MTIKCDSSVDKDWYYQQYDEAYREGDVGGAEKLLKKQNIKVKAPKDSSEPVTTYPTGTFHSPGKSVASDVSFGMIEHPSQLKVPQSI